MSTAAATPPVDPLWELDAAGIHVGILGRDLLLSGDPLWLDWGGHSGSWVVVGASGRVAVAAASDSPAGGPYPVKHRLTVTTTDSRYRADDDELADDPRFPGREDDALTHGGISDLAGALTLFATDLAAALRHVGDLPDPASTPTYPFGAGRHPVRVGDTVTIDNPDLPTHGHAATITGTPDPVHAIVTFRGSDAHATVKIDDLDYRSTADLGARSILVPSDPWDLTPPTRT